MLQEIKTPKAPSSKLYSQALRTNGFLFLAGQVGIDPITGKLVEGGITEQFHRVFANIEAILESASLSLHHLVRVDIFLKDFSDFVTVNALYHERISHPIKPVRQALQVAHLPFDALIEVTCIAVENL